jgi:hypothetical protein
MHAKHESSNVSGASNSSGNTGAPLPVVSGSNSPIDSGFAQALKSSPYGITSQAEMRLWEIQQGGSSYLQTLPENAQIILADMAANGYRGTSIRSIHEMEGRTGLSAEQVRHSIQTLKRAGVDYFVYRDARHGDSRRNPTQQAANRNATIDRSPHRGLGQTLVIRQPKIR